MRLKAKLRFQERTAREGPFGSSTPSSKIPIKANSLEERQQRKGGGKYGHVGHGRQTVPESKSEPIEHISAPDRCPDCGIKLLSKGYKRRAVIDCHPIRMIRKIFRLECKRCPRCGKQIQAQTPGVLPKSLYGNQLLTHVAVEHYLRGLTLGQLERQTGVGYSSLVEAMHGLAGRLEPCMERFISEYRQAPVKHADETGWRTDGQNGYAWLFTAPLVSIFRFRKSRSAKVAQEVFGSKRLSGVLVVDRYNAYNKIPCHLQYCFAHLLRAVEDLEKEFPENPEIQAFVQAFAPLLAQAMHLRTLRMSHRQFKRQARAIRQSIRQAVSAPARHPGIQQIQNIFRENNNRLFLWCKTPVIPADNNFAERELRPLVIARRISFGSQSDAGAHTREILMSVLLTMQKRTPNVAATLKSALDTLIKNPTADIYNLLFPPDSS